MFSLKRLFTNARCLWRDERGQGLVEYALIVATVSLVAIAALNVLGKKANNTLSNAAASLR
jgi:Flp pilus assembly pilin Flp